MRHKQVYYSSRRSLRDRIFQPNRINMMYILREIGTILHAIPSSCASKASNFFPLQYPRYLILPLRTSSCLLFFNLTTSPAPQISSTSEFLMRLQLNSKLSFPAFHYSAHVLRLYLYRRLCHHRSFFSFCSESIFQRIASKFDLHQK